ncbi:MAG TPA: D-amino acid dehydrogenase [Burkholderiales bacterium]|nr:D-amino acid dehydrogenase [Burkholderiales bacterium]
MKILILGAGVIGVTSAWYLAADGHEVTLVDRAGGPGMETSFANGGQISASHAEPWARPAVLPKILKWLGREDAPLRFRPRADAAQWRWAVGFLRECLPGRFEANTRALAGLAAYSRECLRALRAETGIRYDELARGILHFCTEARDFDALARHAEAMKAFGVSREVKSAAECKVIEPALKDVRLAGGIFAPQDESGDAHRFTQNLARLCEAKGVRFMSGHTVHNLRVEAQKATAVHTSAGALDADAYVVSLGSYSPALLAPHGMRLPVYPLKGYSVTLPLDGAQAEAPTVSLTDESRKIVISRFGDRLRAAGTAELAGYDTSINAVRCNAIVARIQALFPALRGRAPSHRWAGLRPATPGNVPIIGRTRLRNVFVNTGHGTLGWTLACGSARALSSLVAGRDPGVDFRFLQ